MIEHPHLGQYHYWLLAFSIIAPVSVVCSAFVTWSILSFGARTASSRLIIYLHLSLFVDDVATFPFIFVDYATVCSIAGFFKAYTGLCNRVICLAMTALAYRLIFMEEKSSAHYFLTKRVHFAMFVVPLFVVLLPFCWSDDVYGVFDDIWCAFSNGPIGNDWNLAYICVCTAVILVTISLFVAIVWRIHRTDVRLRRKVFKGIGLYVLVSVFCFLPRILTVGNGVIAGTLSNSLPLFYLSRLFTYLAGILNAIVFLMERRSLRVFEKLVTNDQLLQSETSGDGDWFYDEVDQPFLEEPVTSTGLDSGLRGRL